MNQLLLSSERLSEQKTLATGCIDIFELLEKQGTDNIHLQANIPPSALQLTWKEVSTPATSKAMTDLIGKKMSDYKFQYLGQFTYKGNPIANSIELFDSTLAKKTIHNHSITGEGWVNCTWLLDMLMNADSKPMEKVYWKEDSAGYSLTLTSRTTGGKSNERQQFRFNENFDTLDWEHCILFPQ